MASLADVSQVDLDEREPIPIPAKRRESEGVRGARSKIKQRETSESDKKGKSETDEGEEDGPKANREIQGGMPLPAMNGKGAGKEPGEGR